jgi:glycosyltransferase involved in cell wall biosynthesis
VAPDYSIVIPAYNEDGYLPRTLACLAEAMDAARPLAGEVIVVDNASTDRTAAVAAAAGARVVFEPHRQIARARNAGAAVALGRCLVFLDADTLISGALFRRTLACLESGLYCGGGTRIVFEGRLPASGALLLGFLNFTMRVVRWAAGSYCFCLREAFDGCGGFDERFYVSEEAHFSLALRKWGRRRRLEMAALTEPAVTSSRKLEWFGMGPILMSFLRGALDPALTRTREGCPMWYERP